VKRQYKVINSIDATSAYGTVCVDINQLQVYKKQSITVYALN